jgi:predicted unusual protein kinase regulating ubiquinone biosynthesis (AarF/ABC1/UbiB family)
MELMEGFQTAKDYFLNRNLYIPDPDPSNNEKYRVTPNNDYDKFLLYIIQYEFQRLSRLGYYHGDSHLGNVMINVDYKYFIFNQNSNFAGRAIIIDFGRTEELSQADSVKAQQGDVSIFKRERYANLIPPNLVLKQDYYNLLRQARLNYINAIAGPLILQNFNVQNMSLKQFVDQIINMNQYNFTKRGGKVFNINNDYDSLLMNKIDNNFDNNLLVKSNTIMKNQNQPQPMDNIFDKFKLELEEQNKTNPSSIFSLEPISKQIKDMDIKEFQSIIQNQYFNNEDVLQEKIGGKYKKYKINKKYKSKRINNSNKINKTKTKKCKKKYY